jgi:hypothetical protein
VGFHAEIEGLPEQLLTAEAWLESGGRSPNEQAVKVRLRELLGSGSALAIDEFLRWRFHGWPARAALSAF